MRKAAKLTTKILHPVNFKQNVPNALAIFIKNIIFPVIASVAAFLTLFSQWWVFSNSKALYSTANYLEHASLLTRHGRLDPDLARRENSQLREIYSDFTNRFSILENIKMPGFAYRSFTCGGT